MTIKLAKALDREDPTLRRDLREDRYLVISVTCTDADNRESVASISVFIIGKIL